MLEEHFALFSLVAAIRGAFGRRSVALLFRSRELVKPRSLRHWAKRIVLLSLRAVKATSVLTIVPFDVDASLNKLADDWIYDPQAWDLGPTPEPLATELGNSLVDWSDGRELIIALGAQSSSKGFDLLCETWLVDPEIRRMYAFVAVGKLAESSAELAKRFMEAGGMLVNRFVDDEELFDLYARASYVWACYSPQYDQASGILGRAFQFGVPAIVRQGSYSDKIARLVGAAVLAVHYEPAAVAQSLLELQACTPISSAFDVSLIRKESERTLFRALGLLAVPPHAEEETRA